VSNPQSTQGNQHLSFAYFQKCINPIFLTQLQSQGSATTNTCAGAGCHAFANPNATGLRAGS
jgi:hypothetical protein